MSCTELTLVDHQNSMEKLKASMTRVGASMLPADFIRAVSNAYHEVEAPRHAVDMHAYFRSSGGHNVFVDALKAAKATFRGPVSILDMGCGAGYELEVLREIFTPSEVSRIVCCDISADMQSIARKATKGFHCRFVLGNAEEALVYGPYDLVVTHAMIHHVADLSAFFDVIERAVVPGGAFVMGHEPNQRYWRNAECMAVLKRLKAFQRRKRRIRKFLEPSRYLYKLIRLAGFASDNSLEKKVNRILRDRFSFSSDLTPQEIHRLVDIHVPTGLVDEFKIGLDGFDIDDLQSGLLRRFKLRWVGTSGYMGESCSPSSLPLYWQSVNEQLAFKYPLDGSNFSAYWHKDLFL
jgi:SAM-dependent methyltransferase